MSRTSTRQQFDERTRLTLVEEDADRADAARSDLRKELVEMIGHLQDDVKTMKTTLIGILVATTTASIFLAIQTLAS